MTSMIRLLAMRVITNFLLAEALMLSKAAMAQILYVWMATSSSGHFLRMQMAL